MINWILKYRNFIAFCSWVLGLLIIVIDMKFISHKYPTTFQWMVALVCLFITGLLTYCVVDKEDDQAPPVAPEEKEYSFIWYKRMVNNGTTHYTRPFRTKVKATNREIAKRKVELFAMQKMTLIVVDESKFNTTELAEFDRIFDEMTKQQEKLRKEFESKIYHH